MVRRGSGRYPCSDKGLGLDRSLRIPKAPYEPTTEDLRLLESLEEETLESGEELEEIPQE